MCLWLIININLNQTVYVEQVPQKQIIIFNLNLINNEFYDALYEMFRIFKLKISDCKSNERFVKLTAVLMFLVFFFLLILKNLIQFLPNFNLKIITNTK